MADRALVAYERPDGRYNLHYAHWGASADLTGTITPATPFGGPDPRAEWAADLLRDLVTATWIDPERVGGRVPDGATTRVDPVARAMAVPRERLTDHVAFGMHEAVHLVDRSFDVASFLVVPFSLAALMERDGGDHREAGGVLLPVDGPFDAARARVAGARAALGAAVDCGVGTATARRALLVTLARWVGADRLLVDGGDRTGDGP